MIRWCRWWLRWLLPWESARDRRRRVAEADAHLRQVRKNRDQVRELARDLLSRRGDDQFGDALGRALHDWHPQ